MKEADFQLEIKHSIEAIPGVFFHHLDPWIIGAQAQAAPRRPYDCYAVYQGIHFAFEIKLHQGTQAFPVAEVKPHQIEALRKVELADGVGAIIVGYRLPPEYRFFPTARVIPIQEWLLRVDRISRYNGRKSFPVGDLLEMGYWMKWLGKGLWEMEDLLKNLLAERKKCLTF